MCKKIITISREFGSGGRDIGKRIADQLGIPFYDKDIIEKVVESTGFAKEHIEAKGEYAPIKSFFAYAFAGRDSSGKAVDDYIYDAQRKIILDIADEGPCVIVGRCADYILRKRTDCLHVFIHGNTNEKCARIMSMFDKTEEEAKRMMKDTDKKRRIHYNYYTDQQWGNIKNYSLTLNSSEIGFDTCVRVIEELAK